MDISSLSQQLNISVKELRQKLSEAGFKVSPRARKIDNTLARDILNKLKPQPKIDPVAAAAQPKSVTIPKFIAVRDLAALLQRQPAAVIKVLITNGVMASVNEQIDLDAAAVVAREFGYEPQEAAKDGAQTTTVSEILAAEDSSKLTLRPPIVAVMGHVDHGKTKLLDTIRKTNVIATEAGAITQHIGAYRAGYNDKTITFLDTPGHEAFAAMRARGANVTDIIVLVVAADDGVKPQTLEVVNRAKITKTPMIVAINKIDKPESNVDRVKQQLADAGVLPEEWGGKTIFVPISAKAGTGVDKLLDTILLVSEIEHLQASPSGKIVGTVIEAHLSKTQGPVATVLIQNGMLKVGDAVAVGSAYGRVRTLEDELGKSQKAALPSVPVRIAGLSDLPEVGDILTVYDSTTSAQAVARKVLLSKSAKRLAYKTGIVADAESQQLKLIIKADTNGSLEAITQELSKLENQDVAITIVSQGIGDINETDVLAAESARATLIGFHNKASATAVRLARQKSVNIDIYEIIYELTEDLTRAILQLVIPEVEQVVEGRAKILAVFRTEKNNMIVGGKVLEGKLLIDKKAQVIRDSKLLGLAKITELQSNRMPVREVVAGSEFGVKLEITFTVEKGDTMNLISERMKEKKLKKKPDVKTT